MNNSVNYVEFIGLVSCDFYKGEIKRLEKEWDALRKEVFELWETYWKLDDDKQAYFDAKKTYKRLFKNANDTKWKEIWHEDYRESRKKWTKVTESIAENEFIREQIDIRLINTRNSIHKNYIAWMTCENNECKDCRGWYCTWGNSAISSLLDAASIGLTLSGAGIEFAFITWGASSVHNLINYAICGEFESVAESQTLNTLNVIADFGGFKGAAIALDAADIVLNTSGAIIKIGE